jgi:hypothetical protein
MPKKVDPHKAYYLGKSSKGRGFIRLSPFYEDEQADVYWYGGYDGKTEEEMGLKLVVVGGMATPAPGETNPLTSGPLPGDPPVVGM